MHSTTITTGDNHQLQGTFYRPMGRSPKAAIMISPATGIKRQFYTAFASYLAENGFGVLTFDNRGIGESLSGSLRDSKASLQDWGQLDMPAVLKALKAEFSNVPYHLIGHSAGGQLVGLMPNANDLSSMFTVASSSGQIKNMDMPFRLQARFFMNVFIPLSNRIFGYTKSQWIGMGEPLPKHVAQQWTEWCNGEGYVKTAFEKTVDQHWYHDLQFPSYWLNATDDAIANEKNVHDMLSVFTNHNSTVNIISPQEHALNEIGHMKYFSRKNSKLWDLALEWVDRYS